MPSMCRVCAEYVSCVESSDQGALLLLPVQPQPTIFCHPPPGDFERRPDPGMVQQRVTLPAYQPEA